jgi:hypothetical protein
LTLDFGPLDAQAPLALVLTGWLQYGDASTNIALSQNPTIQVIPPRLYAETDSDRWAPVDVVVGIPAGKTKTIVCDLAGRLPMGTRRLRLDTTFELRWDRIALMERRADHPAVTHELVVSSTNLAWRGFSELRSRAEGHPTTPDHEQVTPRPAWRTTPAGWCTRYGDVTELAARRDNRLVIVNAGDALTVNFAADGLPALAEGWTRTFFLYSVGWDKDADHNVVAGDTIAPLPRDETLPAETSTDGFTEFDVRWVPQDRDANAP